MSVGKLVLVTGVSGFIAGQVVQKLLDAGYRVRGTARREKFERLAATVHLDGLEFVRVDDIATDSDNLAAALKDVYAVVHVACPLPGRASVDETLQTAVEGTLNVLRQATDLGISKFVVTSSFGALLDPSLKPAFAGLEFTEKDWGTVSLEDVKAHASNPFYTYFAAKLLAEKAVWEFAKAQRAPAIDVATILPGFVYGPYAPFHLTPTGPSGLGTNNFPFGLVLTTGPGASNFGKPGTRTPPTAPPWVVDVRDVARAHVAALALLHDQADIDSPKKLSSEFGHGDSSHQGEGAQPPLPPPSSSSSSSNIAISNPNLEEDRRFILNAGSLTWKEAARYLSSSSSLPEEVKKMIMDPEDIADLPGVPSTLDTRRARDVLGLREMIAPEKTIEDAILAVLEIQKTWSPACA